MKNLSSFLYVCLKNVDADKRKRPECQEGLIKKNKHNHNVRVSYICDKKE